MGNECEEAFEFGRACFSSGDVAGKEGDSVRWRRRSERKGGWLAFPGEAEGDELVVVGELVEGAVTIAGVGRVEESAVGRRLRDERECSDDFEGGVKKSGGGRFGRRGRERGWREN